MSPRPAKHSLTLNGHRTSVTLEPDFWDAFCDLAARRGMALNALAAEVDAERAGQDMGLATALRLYVLRALRAEAVQARGESLRSDAR